MIYRLRDLKDNTIHPLTGLIKQIGRGPDCDIVISDPQVSRQHARMDKIENAWVIVDLDSRNGTLLNGEKIREKSLNPGDIIQLGTVRLQYEIDDTAKETDESTKAGLDRQEAPGILNRILRPKKK